MTILTRTTYADGRKYWLSWTLISTKWWSLDWHPHTKGCKYGWYHNKTLSGGLWMNLNLPLFGDFSLWKHYISYRCK